MKRVLLVPDHGIVEELGASYLDRLSFSVRSAHDAAEALTMAAVYRPDLIVLRDDLGGTSLRAFALALRQVLPKVRLLLVTELLGEGLDGGADLCDGRLVQPVSSRQLLDTAASLLDVRVRRGPRVSIDALVQLAGFGLSTADGTCVGNAIDVSEYGLLVESSEQLTLGSDGKLTFHLPCAAGRVAVEGTARVAMDEVRLHYAIEFVSIDEASHTAMGRFFAEIRKA